MAKGLFITVEGGDGAGKSTQLAFLREYLTERGHNLLFTREPGGTSISEKIRAILLDKDNRDMEDMTEALLYAASRAQLVAQVIKPALAEGKTVVCDRYVDSSIAYQGYGRDLGDSVSIINDFAIDGLLPDLTILLKLTPDEGRHRQEDRAPADRLESETDAFHRKVYEGYLALEAKYPQRICGVDASLSIQEVSEQIQACLDRLLAERR